MIDEESHRFMLRVASSHRIEDTESAIRHVIERRGGHLLATSHLGRLLQEKGASASQDAVVFTVCLEQQYAGMLAADMGFAAFLPCRIAARSSAGGVLLETMDPHDFCRLINRPDLNPLGETLASALQQILEETAREPTGAHRHPHRHFALGAHEGQVNMRGTVPQRVDCRGTKIEDIAGTGEHDAAGG